jgi:hypothetical protein
MSAMSTARRRLLRPEVSQELVNIKWTPPPRILVGEFHKPRHDATPALDGVDRQTACEHLSAPPIDHRVEYHLVGAEQRNIVETQNVWNKPWQLVSHAAGPPKPRRL